MLTYLLLLLLLPSSKVDKIMDIVTGNPTVIKMVIHYTRSAFLGECAPYTACIAGKDWVLLLMHVYTDSACTLYIRSCSDRVHW